MISVRGENLTVIGDKNFLSCLTLPLRRYASLRDRIAPRRSGSCRCLMARTPSTLVPPSLISEQTASYAASTILPAFLLTQENGPVYASGLGNRCVRSAPSRDDGRDSPRFRMSSSFLIIASFWGCYCVYLLNSSLRWPAALPGPGYFAA